MKNVIIMQPFGLGDCIFAQGIAHHYLNGGYKVYWPVVQQYLHALRRAYPKVIWLPEDLYLSENLFGDRMLIQMTKHDLLHALCAPIRWSNTFEAVPYREVMKAKYSMYGLDWRTWNQYSKWERDVFKEEELLALTNGATEFNLISQEWGCHKTGTVDIKVNNGLPNIHIRKMEGYSLFDWSLLMQRATTIHFVSSSNIYLLESMDLDAKEIHLYPRLPDQPTHINYEYILQRHKYILH